MIFRLGIIHLSRFLRRKKEELENKNNITDEDDVLYVRICEELKIFNNYLDIIREFDDEY